MIDDRALASEDEDAFRLLDIVDEVVELCGAVPVPATLAVYGSWGSGKSSLANLLEARFASDKKIAFARFDAFKYAQVPLRRHFLSQVATKLGVKDREFSEGLYESTKKVRLQIPSEQWGLLVLALFAALLLMTVLAGLGALAVALVSEARNAGFWEEFQDALRASLPGVAIATPVVAAAVALVGKHLTADTTTEAPSSEEQFEALFEKLVKRVKDKEKCERIVVFIDELDRCSPAQVVSALETLRTFLEVEPCIFIVAADQQVLEHALDEAVRQATPLDPANPYYSGGSAYLDKIFQYQLPLPPILPRRLSRFALDLIKNRNGVWLRVGNRGDLVSVLVPTHVSSPRRVKALLNAFALLYRLALRRAAEGTIDENIEARAGEVAKLVCLRTEFPIFARDLQLSHRLPEIVRYIIDNPTVADDELAAEFVGVSPEALRRAHGYGSEELHVGEVIAKPTEVEEGEAGDEEEDEVENVQKSHTRQLLRYLERTREIPDPGRDIIYLESPGAAFELPADLAEGLERNAVDGQVDEVEQAFGQLEEADQRKALRLLAWLIREAVGIERRNVARCLFRALAALKGDAAPVAADLLNALVFYNAGYRLEAEDLPGALTLALSDDGPAAMEMQREVLARDEVVDDDDLALLVLSRLKELRSHRDRLADSFAGVIGRGHGEEAADAVRSGPDDDVANLIEPLALEGDDETAVSGLADFVDAARAQKRARVAMLAFARLVESDGEVAAEAAFKRVKDFAPVTDSRLAGQLVNRVRTRPVSEWPTWLDALDADVAKGLRNMESVIGQYVGQLWKRRFAPAAGEPAATAEDFTEAGRQLGRLRPGTKDDEERPTFELLAELPAVTAAAQVDDRQEQYEALDELADLGALDKQAAAEAILADLGRTLAASGVAPLRMAEFVRDGLPLGLASAGEDVIDEFAQAAEDSPWFDGVPLDTVRVRSACALRRRRVSEVSIEDESLEALVGDEGDSATEALADWIDSFTPSAVEVHRVLEPRLEHGARLQDPLRPVVSRAAPTWSADDKADLLEIVSRPYVIGEIDDSVVRAFGLSDAADARAGEILIARYEEASNNDVRERVLDLWGLVNPASSDVQRKLIDEVYIPLLGQGTEATRIALGHFDLVRNPPSDAARERLKRAIRTAAGGKKELAKKADSLVRREGWVSKARKWLRW